MNDPKENLLNVIGTLNQKLVGMSPKSEKPDAAYVNKLRDSIDELDTILQDPKFTATMDHAFWTEALGMVRESILMQKITFNEGLIDQDLFSDLFKPSFKIYAILKSREEQSIGS